MFKPQMQNSPHWRCLNLLRFFYRERRYLGSLGEQIILACFYKEILVQPFNAVCYIDIFENMVRTKWQYFCPLSVQKYKKFMEKCFLKITMQIQQIESCQFRKPTIIVQQLSRKVVFLFVVGKVERIIIMYSEYKN